MQCQEVVGRWSIMENFGQRSQQTTPQLVKVMGDINDCSNTLSFYTVQWTWLSYLYRSLFLLKYQVGGLDFFLNQIFRDIFRFIIVYGLSRARFYTFRCLQDTSIQRGFTVSKSCLLNFFSHFWSRLQSKTFLSQAHRILSNICS